jgi:D-3-phosphoglycerate dehydrogenase
MSLSTPDTGEEPLVVAIDDGYASYDQEESLLREAGARFVLRPVHGNAQFAADAVRDASIVLVRESPVQRAAIDGMVRCRAVIRYGIGVDNIDLQAARERRIPVANVPDYGTDEVSTQAVALALALNRHLLPHDREVRAGRWSNGVLVPMHRLRGRVLGLAGYGRIARMTQAKFAGFGFSRVLVHDPGSSPLPEATVRCELDELCREADVISLHTPLTPHTRGMIDARRLALMKPTTLLINTARGGLVDTEALCQALASGRLGGAGLDVLDPEPPAAEHPLLKLNNVIITNHIGWYSEESLRDLQRKAAEEAVRALRGEPLLNWLNPWN